MLTRCKGSGGSTTVEPQGALYTVESQGALYRHGAKGSAVHRILLVDCNNYIINMSLKHHIMFKGHTSYYDV